MKCPVCGKDHILLPEQIPKHSSDHYKPCEFCLQTPEADKAGPPELSINTNPCEKCGRRHIDSVMTEIYREFVNTGIFKGSENLSSVGVPLINPGIFLRRTPYLPERSLLLISNYPESALAEKMYKKIPELSGIITGDERPGANDNFSGFFSEKSSFSESRLLAGCDCRGDLFLTMSGPVLIYKMQRAIHIEYPKASDPKIRSLEANIKRVKPDTFIDACSGAGTLGISALICSVTNVILCDIWYAAAFFSAFNLFVNQKALKLNKIEIYETIDDLKANPIRIEPGLIAKAEGKRSTVSVYHGDINHLNKELINQKGRILISFDPFDKRNIERNSVIIKALSKKLEGEVFIP